MYRSTFKFRDNSRRGWLILIFVAFLLGCSEAPQPTGPETFTLKDHKVEFRPPPADWTRQFQTEAADLGQPEDMTLGLVFNHPGGDGRLAVTNIDVSDALVDGEYKPLDENKALLNKLVEPIYRREGKKLSEDYIQVDGQNAYHILFEYGQGATAHQGEQVHFTKDKQLYSISLLVPKTAFADSAPVLDQVVKTFKVIQ